MAGHSQFKNIMYRKGAQDKKRAKVFSKHIREIQVAARSGLPDVEMNPALKTAVAAAKAAAPNVKVLHYNLWARYDHGFQATPWPEAERLGLAGAPSFYGVVEMTVRPLNKFAMRAMAQVVSRSLLRH